MVVAEMVSSFHAAAANTALHIPAADWSASSEEMLLGVSLKFIHIAGNPHSCWAVYL